MQAAAKVNDLSGETGYCIDLLLADHFRVEQLAIGSRRLIIDLSTTRLSSVDFSAYLTAIVAV